MKRVVKASTPYAKPITSEDWILSARNVMEHSEDLISPLWIRSTTSITSRAPYAQLCSERKTVTTNTTAKSIAISTIQHNLLNAAMGAKPRFSNNLWKYSGTVRISTGILNAT
jgi:hypothetical protein